LHHAGENAYGGQAVLGVVVDEIAQYFVRFARVAQEQYRNDDQRRGERRAEYRDDPFQRFSRLPHILAPYRGFLHTR